MTGFWASWDGWCARHPILGELSPAVFCLVLPSALTLMAHPLSGTFLVLYLLIVVMCLAIAATLVVWMNAPRNHDWWFVGVLALLMAALVATTLMFVHLDRSTPPAGQVVRP